jgi:hypothetical protein
MVFNNEISTYGYVVTDDYKNLLSEDPRNMNSSPNNANCNGLKYDSTRSI